MRHAKENRIQENGTLSSKNTLRSFGAPAMLSSKSGIFVTVMKNIKSYKTEQTTHWKGIIGP